MSRGVLLAILAVALVGGLSGLWLGQHLQRGEAERAREAALEIARPGSPMPAFSLPGPAGGTIDSAAYAGRPLLVNFWATWCQPCLREMPALEALHGEIEVAGGAVIGIALDGAAPVAAFVAELGITYPIAVAEGIAGTRLARRFGNAGGLLPYSVFVNRAGRITDVVFGELDHQEAAARIAPLLR